MDLDIMKMVIVWREDLMKGISKEVSLELLYCLAVPSSFEQEASGRELLSKPKLEEGRLLGSQFLSFEIGNFDCLCLTKTKQGKAEWALEFLPAQEIQRRKEGPINFGGCTGIGPPSPILLRKKRYDCFCWVRCEPLYEDLVGVGVGSVHSDIRRKQ